MKHLFFDLDHTLWDFDKNSEAALRLLYDDLNLGNDLRSFRSFHTAYKKINAELWYQYGIGNICKAELRVKRFSDTLSKFDVQNKELAEKLAEGYVATSPFQTNLFPHTKETLEGLKNDGYALHIITNGFKEIQDIKLTNSGIRNYFDIILCSEDVGKSKPAPEVFHTALNNAKATAHESLMIGDNYHADVLGAERAGITGVLFDPHFEHHDGRHDWQIRKLNEIPELIPWIIQAKSK